MYFRDDSPAAKAALAPYEKLRHLSPPVEDLRASGYDQYLEGMDDETLFEAEATALLDRIDDLGGAVAALETGFVHDQIETSAYRRQREIERSERIVVGVNAFAVDETVEPDLLATPDDLADRRADELAAVRDARDGVAVRHALEELRAAAEGDGPLFVPIREALRRRATLGETCDVLREVWGVALG